jgi:hypothetical protein
MSGSSCSWYSLRDFSTGGSTAGLTGLWKIKRHHPHWTAPTCTWPISIYVQERELQKKYVTASVRETAFNCPHCGALASQQWYTSYITGLENSPFIPEDDFIQKVLNDNEIDHAMKERFLDDAKKRNGGLVFIEKGTQNFSDRVASNLFLSQCFNCRNVPIRLEQVTQPLREAAEYGWRRLTWCLF